MELIHGAAFAAAQSNACKDDVLKEQQRRLAINIAIAVGVDEAEAGTYFYQEYAVGTSQASECNPDKMLAQANAFSDAAEHILDYCKSK
ncbi:MAG: hypothetical protein KF874_02195 [Rhizobiaceae bacterium]|nr:hypothetical protein [Rhizobiaceae bacterium]